MPVHTKSDTHKNKEQVKSIFQYAVKCKSLKPNSQRAQELNLARQLCVEEIKIQKYQQIYFKAYIYKAIFILFSLIFLALSFFAFSQNLTLTTALFGNLNWLPKMAIGIISLSLSIVAITMGKSICIAKESAMQIAEKASSSLQKLYDWENEFGHKECLLKWQNKKKQHLYSYHSLVKAIREKQEETIILLKKIQNSKNLTTKQKSMLFCQALQQMEKELQELTSWNYQERP